MLAKSGGFAAILDRDVVTQCPLCDTDNPDLENRGFCSNCGALFREKIQRRLMTVKAGAVLGVLLTLAGAGLTLALGWHWAGIAVFALGVVPLALGILANQQLASFLLEALGRRTANDTQRSLRTTDRVAAGLLAFFAAAFVSSLLYYVYQIKPQRELARYQARFEGQINSYLKLVPDDAMPPAGAEPYLAGKAVVVEKTASGGQISAAHIALPADVRAETPEEVGTVVLIEWKDFKEGDYGKTGSGVSAYWVDGHLQIIRRADKSFFVPEQAFRGGPPPGTAPADGSHGRGSKPIAQIAEYIATLKREPSSPREETKETTTGEGNAPRSEDQDDSRSESSVNK